MSKTRSEILPFFSNPSHPALTLATGYLQRLRSVTTARGAQFELRRPEEIAALPGVAAVLACEKLGNQADLSIEAACKQSSVHKTHFTNVLIHCRPLIIAQRASSAARSSASPSPSPSKAATRASASSPSQTRATQPRTPPSSSNTANPTPTAQGGSLPNPFLDDLLASSKKKKVSAVPLAGRNKLDLSGLRRNTRSAEGSPSSSTGGSPTPSAALVPASASQPSLHDVAEDGDAGLAASIAGVPSAVPDHPAATSAGPSRAKPSTTSPTRTTPRKTKLTTSSAASPSRGGGSPIHAGLMRGKLEAARRASFQAEPAQTDDDIDMDEAPHFNGSPTPSESGASAIIPRDTPTRARSLRHDPRQEAGKPKDLPQTLFPTSPYITIPTPTIDPSSPWFTHTNYLYPPPPERVDRICLRMVPPSSGEWPVFGSQSTSTAGEKGEFGGALAQEKSSMKEERRKRRREMRMRGLVKGFGMEMASEMVQGPGPAKKLRVGWDAAFLMPSFSLSDRTELDEERMDLEGDLDMSLTWEEKLEVFCESHLPHVKSVLEEETTSAWLQGVGQVKTVEKEPWLERADTRGIGVRMWEEA